VAEYYAKGLGVEQDGETATIWLGHAVAAGSPAAAYKLGLLHLHGEAGFEQSMEVDFTRSHLNESVM
jgi:TPR repeat protein